MPPSTGEASTAQLSNLQNQIESLTRYQDTLTNHLQGLSQQYQSVVSKMLSFQRTLTTQDSVMQNIIQYLANPENSTSTSTTTPFLPGEQTQKLISSYDEAAKASVDIMNDLSQLGAQLAPTALLGTQQSAGTQPLPQVPRLETSQQYGQRSHSATTYSVKSDPIKSEYHTPSRDGGYASASSSPTSQSSRPGQQQPPPGQPVEDIPSQTTDFSGFGHFQFPSQDPSAQNGQNPAGLRVFTVGHLAPREENGDESDVVGHSPPNMPIIKETDERAPRALHVRRQTFVPGWAVPPKILLVDDDAVYRNMSSKFLQVFGCEADVAVDGISALDKVNMEKYDLILMDVVMPNLDGITATNMIRQFDINTPIISMTSNIRSDDIMHYFNSGTLPAEQG
jgi:osomolarity two-component system, response regulator SKN7